MKECSFLRPPNARVKKRFRDSLFYICWRPPKLEKVLIIKDCNEDFDSFFFASLNLLLGLELARFVFNRKIHQG